MRFIRKYQLKRYKEDLFFHPESIQSSISAKIIMEFLLIQTRTVTKYKERMKAQMLND